MICSTCATTCAKLRRHASAPRPACSRLVRIFPRRRRAKRSPPSNDAPAHVLPDPFRHPLSQLRLDPLPIPVGAACAVQYRGPIQPLRRRAVAGVGRIRPPCKTAHRLQPPLDLLRPRRSRQASPLSRSLLLAEALSFRRHRVQMDIHADVQHPRPILHQHGLEPLPKKMPRSCVPPIVPGRVTAIEPLDGRAHIRVRRAHQQVVVVRHQTVGMQPKPERRRQLAQQLHKMPVIAAVQKDRPPILAPTENVVPTSRHADAYVPGHVRYLTHETGTGKLEIERRNVVPNRLP